jgi:hypothetical protein
MVFLSQGLPNWTAMQKILDVIVQLDSVRGCLIISPSGQVLCAKNASVPPNPPESFPWTGLINHLNGIKEADILFAEARLYLRQSPDGYLVIIMEPYAVLAMIRLQCDVLFSALPKDKPKGFLGLFKK